MFAHLVRQVLRASVGIDIQRHNSMTDPFLRLAAMLRQRDIRLVLDVGANDGGYGSALMGARYMGQILSFEPLPDARARLIEKAGAWRGRWDVAPAVALSDRDGHAAFNVAGNSVSSSLLEVMASHTNAAPDSATERQIEVVTRRLDSIWPGQGAPRAAFMKIDTQGSERMVLNGAGELLAGPVVGLQIELSHGALYDGQELAPEMDDYVRSLGFTLWDIIPGFRDPSSFRMLQHDGIYFRNC